MATTDIEIGSPITGEFTAAVNDLSGVAPSDVIRVGDGFQVDCSWFIQGGLASSLGGTWHVQLTFEALGPGAEFRTAEIAVPLDGRAGAPPAPGYSASVVIPAGANFPTGQAKVGAGERSTPYQVTALLSYTDLAGNPGPLAASVNLETVTIYA
jgi:hypothetical protein